MAIVGAGPGPSSGVGGGGLGLRAQDFYPSWGPSRREAAWIALDIGLYFTPFAALALTNKARLGIKLLLAERQASKAQDAFRLGQTSVKILGSTPVRTGLMVALSAPGAVVTSSGLWVVPLMVGDIRDASIAYYRDREGRIRVISPNLSHIQFESRGAQGTVLPAARRAESFFSEDGIQRLAATSLSRTSPSQWHIAILSGRSRGIPAEHPLAEGPRTRARSAPTHRGKKISPWCQRHKRRHWCAVTRARAKT